MYDRMTFLVLATLLRWHDQLGDFEVVETFHSSPFAFFLAYLLLHHCNVLRSRVMEGFDNYKFPSPPRAINLCIVQPQSQLWGVFTQAKSAPPRIQSRSLSRNLL